MTKPGGKPKKQPMIFELPTAAQTDDEFVEQGPRSLAHLNSERPSASRMRVVRKSGVRWRHHTYFSEQTYLELETQVRAGMPDGVRINLSPYIDRAVREWLDRQQMKRAVPNAGRAEAAAERGSSSARRRPVTASWTTAAPP